MMKAHYSEIMAANGSLYPRVREAFMPCFAGVWLDLWKHVGRIRFTICSEIEQIRLFRGDRP